MIRHLGSNDTVCVKIVGEVKDNNSFQLEISRNKTILNTLNCRRDFPEDSQFLTSKIKFLALQICHFQTKIFD